MNPREHADNSAQDPPEGTKSSGPGSPVRTISPAQVASGLDETAVDSAYLEADDGDDDERHADSDSAVDIASIPDDTTSMLSEITKYRYENNRRYHAYKAGEYWGPNDEKQNNQQDIAHHLFTLTLGGKLFLAPIGDNPQSIVDVGTGTGIWAIDVADQFPSAVITGFDLSPTQPSWVAPNVRFEVNDACAADWAYPKNSFDYVHIRGMYGSVADWPAFYKQAMIHLKPGGWIEQSEISVVPLSNDNSIPPGHIFERWGSVSLDAGEKFGKTLRIHELAKGFIEDEGFTNVVEKVYILPIGPWCRDPHLKQLGLWNQLHWEEGIEGWSLALLTRFLGWTYLEVQAYLGKMRTALRDKNVHAYHLMNVVYAQKPAT